MSALAALALKKALPSWASRVLVVLLLLVLLATWAFIRGVGYEHAKWEAADAEQERVYLRAVERAAKIADRVTVEYVDRWHTVTKRGEAIVKEVPVYVTPKADAACVVNRGFVRVHDTAAANGVLPAAAAADDEAAPNIALSTVATTVTDNYTEFHAMKAQCEALQRWAREVSAGTPAPAGADQ